MDFIWFHAIFNIRDVSHELKKLRCKALKKIRTISGNPLSIEST